MDSGEASVLGTTATLTPYYYGPTTTTTHYFTTLLNEEIAFGQPTKEGDMSLL